MADQAALRVTRVGPESSNDPGFGFPDMQLNSGFQLPFPMARTAPPLSAQLSIPGMNIADVNYRPNKVIGLNSFSTIPSHYNTLVDNSDDQSKNDVREISLGQLLFARNHRKAKKRAGLPGPMYSQHVGPNNVEFKELLQLNRHLVNAKDMYETAADVVAEWRMLGVLKNEVAPNANIPYGTAPRSRTVNLIVGHRVSVLDYWAGFALTASMPLYLVVKWVDKGVADGYWQVFPYADPDEPYPPLEEVTFKKRGTWMVGEVIRVGVTSESRQRFQNGNPNLSLTKSMAAQGMLQTIEIYIGAARRGARSV